VVAHLTEKIVQVMALYAIKIYEAMAKSDITFIFKFCGGAHLTAKKDKVVALCAITTHKVVAKNDGTLPFLYKYIPLGALRGCPPNQMH